MTRIIQLLKDAFNSSAHDFTTINIRKAVVLLAIPMILEMCLESVFAVVDLFFVNRLGPGAVSIVGLTESVTAIVYSVAIGLSSAATAIVARRIGEKNNRDASKAAAQATLMAVVVSLVMGVIGFVFAKNILQFMGAAPSAIEAGLNYTRIQLGTSIVVVLLFMLNGIFRGAGDAALAMRSLWVANICNIILCPVLINGYGPFPQMGITGAAVATCIGRGIGVLYQVYFLIKAKHIIHFYAEDFVPEWLSQKALAGIATPAIFQFLISSASWIFLAAIVAQSGVIASAGYQTAIRLVIFFILPAWGLSNAAVTLVGQNLGAQQPQRAEQAVMKTAKYNAIFMAMVTLLFYTCGEWIIRFFTPANQPEQIAIAVQALKYISSAYIFYGIGMVLMLSFNGAGDTRTPTIISFVGFWLLQIPLAYLLSHHFQLNYLGVFIAIPFSETVMAIISYFVFKQGKWKTVKV